jgi:23S rRNA pseudouridine1911/1915/1917 synthase
MQKKVMDLFRNKKIKKTYIAFLQGIPACRRGIIDSPIDGARAVTSYQVIEIRGNFSIARVSLETGKKNQIRIHFRRLNHPLVGEAKFAFRKDYALKAKRACLHAKAVEFIHPQTLEPLKIEAPMALDLENFLKKHPPKE